MELTHERGGVGQTRAEVLESYDASHLVGLNVIVLQSARRTIDEDNEEYIEVPWLDSLAKAAAVVRCLMPVRLKGSEVKAIRRILELTGKEMAKRLDTKPETISRWENGAQGVGSFLEKIFRLHVCEELKEQVKGIEYDAKMISHMLVMEPWPSGDEWQPPPMVLKLIKVRIEDRCSPPEIRDEWNNEQMAA